MCEAARSARPDQRMFLSLRAGDELTSRLVNIRSQRVFFAHSGLNTELLFIDILITIVFGFIFKTVRFKMKEKKKETIAKIERMEI